MQAMAPMVLGKGVSADAAPDGVSESRCRNRCYQSGRPCRVSRDARSRPDQRPAHEAGQPDEADPTIVPQTAGPVSATILQRSTCAHCDQPAEPSALPFTATP